MISIKRWHKIQLLYLLFPSLTEVGNIGSCRCGEAAWMKHVICPKLKYLLKKLSQGRTVPKLFMILLVVTKRSVLGATLMDFGGTWSSQNNGQKKNIFSVQDPDQNHVEWPVHRFAKRRELLNLQLACFQFRAPSLRQHRSLPGEDSHHWHWQILKTEWLGCLFQLHRMLQLGLVTESDRRGHNHHNNHNTN